MAEADAPIEAVVDALNAAGVEYVLIGGAAMMLHGAAYVTQDVDLCYARNVTNIAALVEALAPFRPTLRLDTGESVPFLWQPRTLMNGSNFTLQTSVGDVDILAVVTGLGSYEDMAQYTGRYMFGEREVQMLTIEGLIVSKRAAGRLKDQLVLPELEVLFALEQLQMEPEPAIDISSLPVYVPRLHEPVVLREDLQVEMSQSMRILGRSADGDRVLGRSGAGILSVARDAFSAIPQLEQDVILSRVDGRDVALSPGPEPNLER